MSFYVYRVDADRQRHGWVGPIRSEIQAGKEKAAWESCGWVAVVHPSSPDIKAKVRAWQKARAS